MMPRRPLSARLCALAGLLAFAPGGTTGAFAATGGAGVAVPSGQPVFFHEMLWDRPGVGLVYRFRFVAPEIGSEGREFEDVMGDMEFLCQEYALPRLAETGPKPSQVVISLSQSEVEFGQAAPEVVQFFEAYRIEGGICIWEIF